MDWQSAPKIPVWPAGVPEQLPGATPAVLAKDRLSGVHTPELAISHPPAQVPHSGTTVLICPGGGYARMAMGHEGAATANWLNSLGVSTGVLSYRVMEYGHPHPLRDVLQAMRRLRELAPTWGGAADRVGIVGYSAGGHLAASACVHHLHPAGQPPGEDRSTISARPDFAVLLYPVITFYDPFAHAGSRRNLLGSDPSDELIRWGSLHLHVTAETCPTLLMHAADDTAVPVENSLHYAHALRSQGVEAELHIFAEGGHGFGLGKPGLPCRLWPTLAEAWLWRRGWLPGAKS